VFITKQREHNSKNCFNQILLNDKDQQLQIITMGGAKSALYDYLVYLFDHQRRL